MGYTVQVSGSPGWKHAWLRESLVDIQDDSGGKVNTSGGDNISHYEQKKFI
jgi:hypothetical protein